MLPVQQLKNILKHSKATFIEVDLNIINDNIILKITDNGIGFNANAKPAGIGFANIKRRVEFFYGIMKIQSSPDNGCTLEIKIPIKDLK